jgi:hypothetical protein
MKLRNKLTALVLVGLSSLTACGGGDPEPEQPGAAPGAGAVGGGSAGAGGAAASAGSTSTGGASGTKGDGGSTTGGKGGAGESGAGGTGAAGTGGAGGGAGQGGNGGGAAGAAGSCTAGKKDCSCQPGNGCDAGLYCLNGETCVDSTGYEGGACLPNSMCYTGGVCDAFQGVCVHCDAGTAGCTCNKTGSCAGGLACSAGLCVPASSLPPKGPKCYTPCNQNLTDSQGNTRTCDADGLLEGCIDDQECKEGSCVKPGDPKPTCESDVDCPGFQVCLSGGCYSNCEQSADCPSGLGCYHKTCRTPCQVALAAPFCGPSSACKADDGVNGFCVPVSDASAAPQQLPTGGFTVTGGLKLSNVKTTDTIAVATNGTVPQEFTVRKLWHEMRYADGTVERVDAPRDLATGGFVECDPVKNECPLWWLDVGPTGATKKDPAVTFAAPAACTNDCPSIVVANAGATTAVSWRGQLEFTTSSGTSHTTVEYTQRPEGQWSGSMYYYGTFSDKGLDTWLKSGDHTVASEVENGLIQRWAALLSGSIEGGWDEFAAVLTSTHDESWKFGNVGKLCAAANGGSKTPLCYPYVNANGVSTYVQNPDATPIPTGVSELPIAMNLKLSNAKPSMFTGRVVTASAMHYPANPGVTLDFVGDPADMSSCLTTSKDCIVPLANHGADPVPTANFMKIDLGGRYLPSGASPTCAAGYEMRSFPWYVPGFTDGTVTNGSGALMRAECRDSQLPFNPLLSKDASSLNVNLSGGNPVPDGLPRKRTLQFLDGALVNQDTLFLLFREQYDSFIPGQAQVSAYGYMVMTRKAADLKDEDFVAPTPPASTPKKDQRKAISCDPALFEGYTGLSTTQKVDLMLNGSAASSANFAAIPVVEGTAYAGLPQGIHYLCEDTGLFDGGPADFGAAPLKVACPAGSKVTYFDVGHGPGRMTQTDVATQPCQTQKQENGRAKCQETLNAWISAGASYIANEKPIYACTDTTVAYCDPADRRDMRKGKTFYEPISNNGARSMLPLRPLIDSAFRYKTRFRSSVDGSTLGFAPQICIKGSDQIPYCYDPDEIGEARQRVDCLLSIYTNDMASLNNSPAQRDALRAFLQQSFSEFEPGYDGFERLNAELLVMLGDEAYTGALASRFDLAGMVNASFAGSSFEDDGIDISGGAGAEMYLLYKAAQYYQLSIDRLYLMGANIQAAQVAGTVGSPQNFVSSKTVSMYLERLIGAAAQKARTWGEVAKRYQQFNRPDLARRVTERAYVATYLESALISRLMLQIEASAGNADRPQIHRAIETAQRRYSMALHDMRLVYATLTDSVNYFGYPADYIPFPQVDNLNGQSQTGFEVLAALAHSRIEQAKQREQIAQADYRSGKVSFVQFQSDLVNIRNNYENQLSSICGTFSTADGKVYPAIRKYAQLGDTTSKMGDPCGRLGNGDLHAAMVNTQNTAVGVQAVLLRQQNIMQKIDLIRATAAKQCNLSEKLADVQLSTATKTIKIQEQIDQGRALAAFVNASCQTAIQSIQTAACGPLCQGIGLATAAFALGTVGAGTQLAADLIIANKQSEISEAQAETAHFIQAEGQCAAVKIDAEREVVLAHQELLGSELELLQANYQVQLAMSEVQRKINDAQRLQAQEEEANQMEINIQTAQNDPNVRLYKQSSVENADISFNDAMRAAYEATKSFEYYTSQSYAAKDKLFLVRMIAAGQYNLENYMLELDNAFHVFENTFGTPDLRVMVISLKDDVLRIPRLSDDSLPLTEDQRTKMMREKLKDSSLLDSNGYLSLAFSTRGDKLSPLTRDHKIKYIEADMQGNKLGDYVARLYLRTAGTGAVHTLTDTTSYYVLPERTAVINPSLQGSKTYDSEVYRSTRHHDRPLVNSLWQLIINQRDEDVNKDIDLQSLTDIRILVYYTDFTSVN